MIFETHAHYEDERFDEDRDELLSSMHEHGIGTIVNVGASLDSVKKASAWLVNMILFMQQQAYIRAIFLVWMKRRIPGCRSR